MTSTRLRVYAGHARYEECAHIADMASREKSIIFGPFEFDTQSQQLRQKGLRVRMSASQIRLLRLFLERPRQLITRGEIIACLWSEPDVVDTENGINTAVNRLRKLLNDDPGAPRYIETVVGLGYRFLAEVSESQRPEPATSQTGAQSPAAGALPNAASRLEALDHVAPSLPVQPIPPAQVRNSWPSLLAVAAGLLTLLAAVSFFWERSQSRTPDPSHFLPVSMSLDLVLFEDEHSEPLATAVSPDGQRTAHSDATGIWMYGNGPRTEERIASPPGLRAQHLDWLPDSQRLVVSGTRADHHEEVWMVSLEGAVPRRLMEGATMATASPVGERLAFLRNNGQELWISGLDGQHPQNLLALPAKEGFGFLVWAPTGKWLIVQHRDARQQWQGEIVDPGSGRVVDHQANLRYSSAFILHDGRLFFSESASQASRNAHLVVQNIDLDRGRFLGEAQSVAKFDSPEIQSFSGSADGTRVAAVERHKYATILTADVTSRWTLEHITDITPYSISNYPHAWSPTGDSVLLENFDLLNSGIYEERADGSKLTQLAQLPTDAAMGEFTPDGRWILFLGFPKVKPLPYGIFRVPAGGGTPEQLRTPGNMNEFHCSLAPIGRCVLLETEPDGSLAFYALNPEKGIGRKLRTLPKQETVLGDWSISPDGKTVALAYHDPLHPSIRLISLDDDTEPRELPIKGHGAVLEPIWDPSGRGLYVECKSKTGYVLMHVTLRGETVLLRESGVHIWGVPSRDGRKLAFPSMETKSTLWAGSMQP